MIEQVVVDIKLSQYNNEIKMTQTSGCIARDDLNFILDCSKRVDLFEQAYDPYNLFCFKLPSGLLAIGRLTPNEAESFPTSNRFFVEWLLVDTETYYRCGGNPRALISAAISSLHFCHYSPGRPLCPFALDEQLELFRYQELLDVRNKVGARALAVLVQSVITASKTVFVADCSPALIISCVHSLLPMSARRNLTFSVGVWFRDDATLLVVGARKNRSERPLCEDARRADSYLDLRDARANPALYSVDNTWCAFIENVLNVDFLAYYFYGKLVDDYFSTLEARVENGFVPPFKYLENLASDWLEELEEVSEEDEEQGELEGEETWNPDSEFAEPDVPFSDFEEFGSSSEKYFPNEINALEDNLQNEFARETQDAEFDDPNRSFEDDVLGLTGSSSLFRNVEDALNSIGSRISDEISLSSYSSTPRVDLSPLAKLISEFPEIETQLRKLHTLVSRLVRGGDDSDSSDNLQRFWDEFRNLNNEAIVRRVREIYLLSLQDALNSLRIETEIERVDSVKKLLGCNDVFRTIMGYSSEEDRR